MGRKVSWGAIINEGIAFPYSKEYFNLLKESYEYDLLQQYKRNMKFLESTEYEEMSKHCSFSEGYFQSYRSDVFTEDGENKSSPGIFERIGDFFSRLWQRVMNFFGRIGRAMSGVKYIELKNIGDQWKTMLWELPDIKAIQEHYNVSWNEWATYTVTDPSGAKIPTLKFAGDVDDTTKKGFTNYMASVCIKDANVAIPTGQKSGLNSSDDSKKAGSNIKDAAGNLIQKVTDNAGTAAAVAGAIVLTVGAIVAVRKLFAGKDLSKLSDQEVDDLVKQWRQISQQAYSDKQAALQAGDQAQIDKLSKELTKALDEFKKYYDEQQKRAQNPPPQPNPPGGPNPPGPNPNPNPNPPASSKLTKLLGDIQQTLSTTMNYFAQFTKVATAIAAAQNGWQFIQGLFNKGGNPPQPNPNPNP